MTEVKSTELVLKPERINEVMEKAEQSIAEASKVIQQVPLAFSRLNAVSKRPFHVINNELMGEITEKMQDINERMYNFGRSDTNATRKLMTLQMLTVAGNTFRVLRQVMAQIENRQQALHENYYTMKKNAIELRRLKKKLEKETDEYERLLLQTEIEQKTTSMANSMIYIEGAIKEVGLLLDAYYEIKKNKGIRDDWSELEMEQAEVEGHIRTMFRLAVRDMENAGRINIATCEYFEQFGINYIEAKYHVLEYLNRMNLKLQQYNATRNPKDLPTYEDQMEFLNRMVDLYKDHYKKAMKELGLSTLISEKYTKKD